MAYYSSNADLGMYEATPYGYSYGYAPTQALMPYSSYEFNQPSYYGSYHDHLSVSQPITSYSASTFSQPIIVQYDYNPPQTQFTISYSASEINEVEFIEYDPTPFDGGYDITSTYGKPLQPSDETCYPRSVPDPEAPPLEGFPYGSTPSPYVTEEVGEEKAKPRMGIEPIGANEPEQQSHGGNGNLLENGHGSPIREPLGEEPEREQQSHGDNGILLDNGHGSSIGEPLGEEPEVIYCDENYPWSGYDCGFRNGYGYEDNKQVPQTPCEAMDLCESIFGDWPCLSRKDQKKYGCQEVVHGENNSNQWKWNADYFFGSSHPYGDAIYGYERYN